MALPALNRQQPGPRSAENEELSWDDLATAVRSSPAPRAVRAGHAITMAREGASIVAFDVCEPFELPLNPGATGKDLEETQRLVEKEAGRCIIAKLDARDSQGLADLADQTMAELGRVGVLVFNHGIWSIAPNSWTMTDGNWEETISSMLTCAWKMTKAFIPKIIEGGRGPAGSCLASLRGGYSCVQRRCCRGAGVLGLSSTDRLGQSSVDWCALVRGLKPNLTDWRAPSVPFGPRSLGEN